MRRVVIDAIVARYRRPHNRLTEVNYALRNIEKMDEWYQRREALTRGEITIEQYLASLTDEELLEVYDSQCCQDYR